MKPKNHQPNQRKQQRKSTTLSGKAQINKRNPHQEVYMILDNIRYFIEAGTGMSIEKLKKVYSEEALFYEALKHIPTTKKSMCAALGIPVEGACRTKRKLEKAGKLWEVKQVYCVLTGHVAFLLTTNHKQAPKPPRFIQTSLI